MYFGYTFDFKCSHSVKVIQAIWNAQGPLEWRGSDSEVYGVNLVSRLPGYNARIRVLGEAPDYELEIDLDAVEGTLESIELGVLSAVLGTLLPTIEVKEVRETSSRPQPPRFPRCWIMGVSPVKIALTKEQGAEVLAYDAKTGSLISPAELTRKTLPPTEPGAKQVLADGVTRVTEEEFNRRLAELRAKLK